VTIVTYLFLVSLVIIPIAMKDYTGTEAEIVSKVIDEIIKTRKELGLSHQNLADGARLDRSTISLIENKKRVPSLLTTLRICSVMRLSLADLLKKYKS
jgi:DNA-binding XRE family transcriptional regulator